MNLRNEIIICLPVIIWVNLAIIVIGTVSNLGFPARGAMCPSQQFSEGHYFRFLGDHLLYFLF